MTSLPLFLVHAEYITVIIYACPEYISIWGDFMVFHIITHYMYLYPGLATLLKKNVYIIEY